MIALSRMARSCNKPLSEWLGIDDPAIAFAFETECSEILNEFELERERQMYEAMAVGRLTQSLGGQVPNANITERW